MAPQRARPVMRHVPRKRFGQNFLIDEAAIAAIVAAIAPQPRDRMVEIGPGLGALTRPLAARLDHLHVIEIDRDIVARLRAAFPAGSVTVHEGDALRVRLQRARATAARGRQSALQHFHAAAVSPGAARRGASATSTSCCRRKWWSAWWPRPPLRVRPAVGDAAVPLRDGTAARRAARGVPPVAQGRVRGGAADAVRAPAASRARRSSSSGQSSQPRSPSAARRCATRCRAHFRAADFERLGMDAGLRAQDLRLRISCGWPTLRRRRPPKPFSAG